MRNQEHIYLLELSDINTGDSSYQLRLSFDGRDVLQKVFKTREEALMVKDIVCDYLNHHNNVAGTTLMTFVCKVFEYIKDAEREIKRRTTSPFPPEIPYNAPVLLNPIKVISIKRINNSLYAELSIDVKYSKSGFSGELSANVWIDNDNDKPKSVKDIVDCFFDTKYVIQKRIDSEIEKDW